MVSYNRRELLERSLAAIAAGDRQPDVRHVDPAVEHGLFSTGPAHGPA